jgi:hypothetical protein
MKKTNVLMISAIAVIVIFAGCGRRRMSKTGFLSDYTRLQKVSDSSLRYLDQSALAMYSSYIVDRVEVHFQEGAKAIKTKSEGKLTEQDMADITNYLHSAMMKAVVDSGCRLAYKPGPGVARIRTAITDMEETNVVLAAVPQSRMLTGAGVGGASMEFEVVDSQTGRQIAAGIETRAGSRIPFTGLSDWGGAKAAIDNWAKRVKERLEESRSK